MWPSIVEKSQADFIKCRTNLVITDYERKLSLPYLTQVVCCLGTWTCVFIALDGAITRGYVDKIDLPLEQSLEVFLESAG